MGGQFDPKRFALDVRIWRRAKLTRDGECEGHVGANGVVSGPLDRIRGNPYHHRGIDWPTESYQGVDNEQRVREIRPDASTQPAGRVPCHCERLHIGEKLWSRLN
jgi:hypothetical protein